VILTYEAGAGFAAVGVHAELWVIDDVTVDGLAVSVRDDFQVDELQVLSDPSVDFVYKKTN